MIHSYFYPRSPCGERLAEVDGEDTSSGDFYPRSPCGERPTITGIIYSDRKISIHALLAESDRATSFAVSVAENFYPRSPCGERPEADGIVDVIGEFLSTLSLRRATVYLALIRYLINFYPRSPCGERLTPARILSRLSLISIHALLAESDLSCCRTSLPAYPFLSTLSLRRATTALLPTKASKADFYPRSPCGERPFMASPMRMIVGFLSTLSLRRATLWALRRCFNASRNHFYPRSPCGERPDMGKGKR